MGGAARCVRQTTPGPISISQGAGSALILVRVSGAHLLTQALGGSYANGHGGSALVFPRPGVRGGQAAARAKAIERRTGHDPALGILLGEHLLEALPPSPGAVVAGFWPLPGEIDIRPLLAALAAQGHRIALPVTPRPGLPLAFGAWRPGEALRPGRFGTMTPSGPEVIPDVLLVPLLAFDRLGRRLGYGAGYYDRTLAALPAARAIGCAFAAQEVAEVPAGPYDVPLGAIATEEGVILCPA